MFLLLTGPLGFNNMSKLWVNTPAQVGAELTKTAG